MGPTSHFSTEWKAFKRAFMKSTEFNPFIWICRLISAAANDLTEWSNLRWRRIVPCIGVALIVFMSATYALVFRNETIQPRWCSVSVDSKGTGTCVWIHVHDLLILYLTTMSIYCYIRTSTLSPGILMAEKSDKDPECTIGHSTAYYALNPDAERIRLQSYGPLRLQEDEALRSTKKTTADVMRYHPNPYASHCDKCSLMRPPRCHHCRICNRCVLQYDHHCVWLNNCIGYHNLRYFILTLAYVTMACWYGVFLLYKPFYGPLQERLRSHGGLISYVRDRMSSNLTEERGLFDFPSLQQLQELVLLSNGRIPVQTVLDLVFPFLLGVGCILALFWGTHVKYVLSALTTLEYRVQLDRRYNRLMSNASASDKEAPLINPFDQKSNRRNWEQIMGDVWWHHLWPLACGPPPPPFIPKLSKVKS
jgi:DHHC palmitoyltransferase